MSLGDILSGLVAKVKANPGKAALVAGLGAVGVLALPAGAVVAGLGAVGAAAVALPGVVGGLLVAHPVIVGAGVLAGGVHALNKKDKKDGE